MHDTISRHAAIDALIAEGRNVDSRYLESERIIHESDAVEAISMLPSAYPKGLETIIEALKAEHKQLREMLEKLPSAQPDIVRCKDCKHRDPEDKKCDSGHGILWQLPRDDDWYCADGER